MLDQLRMWDFPEQWKFKPRLTRMNPTPILRVLAFTVGSALLLKGCYTAMVAPMTVLGVNGTRMIQEGCTETPGCKNVFTLPAWEWGRGASVTIQFRLSDKANDSTKRNLRAMAMNAIQKSGGINFEFQVESSPS